jgi:hypothetical protein
MYHQPLSSIRALPSAPEAHQIHPPERADLPDQTEFSNHGSGIGNTRT